jgi:hypothetical protein
MFRYRLRTLLLLTILGPPVLAWLWFILGPITVLALALSVAATLVLLLVYVYFFVIVWLCLDRLWNLADGMQDEN